MADMCTDNRFEIIARAKQAILDGTNIDTSPDEMKVLNNFLFRCWQMGWLDKYDVPDINVGEWIPCSERLPDVEYISGKDPVKGHYLTCDHDGNMSVLSWCEGWNCYRHLNGSAHKDYEITDIVAWMPLPPAYKESED